MGDELRSIREAIQRAQATIESEPEHEAGGGSDYQGEKLAIVTLLETSKRGILPLVVREWRKMLLRGRQVVVYAVRNDAYDDTCAEFAELCRGWAAECNFVNVRDAAKPVATGLGSHYNQAFLARMAILREGARRAALAGDARWILWIDSDITLPEEGFLRLWQGLINAEKAGETVPYPHASAALCCTRYGGAPIPQWLDVDGPASYIHLEPDKRHVARVIGFGAVLMRRETLEELGWHHYAACAADRERRLAEGDPKAPGCQGEDVFWMWLHERRYGTPPMVDTGCRARHYHADGSYFAYDRGLNARYVTKDAIAALQVPMLNTSAREWDLKPYGMRVLPGAECRVSPELAETIRACYPPYDDSRELVAICVLLEDRKAHLLPQLVPKWDAIDVGDRDVVYVVCRQDASDETCQRFGELTKREVRWWAQSDTVDAAVRGIEHIGHGAPGGYTNIVFLHRMALLRELTRVAALATNVNGERFRPADWLLWLDADIDPSAGAPPFLRLHETLTGTTGPLAPRLASGLYATRNTGQDIPQEVSDATGETRYMDLRPRARLLSDLAGFGCVLGHRNTFEAVSWEQYGDYREARLLHLELTGQPAGVLGEDCFYFRQVRERFGGGLVVDCAVLCDHYRDDGAAWHYTDRGGELVAELRRPQLAAHKEADRAAC